jgi:hypothetical protein
LMFIPVDGGAPRPVPGVEAHEQLVRYGPSGDHLFVACWDRLPAELVRIDLASGARVSWATIAPPDSAGINNLGTLVLTPDGQTYAYTFARRLSTLYWVEGLS